jgi:ABC-type multidrug transport system fused ATPase/permease subunit
VSLLRIIERHRLIDEEALAQIRWLQSHKGYSLEEALGSERAHVLTAAAARLDRERRRLSLVGIARVFAELRHHPGSFGLLILLSVGSAVCSFPFVFSWYLGMVLNHLVTSRDVSSLLSLTGVAATVLMTSILFDFLLSAWASRCNFQLNQRLMMRLWHRVLTAPFPVFQRLEHGELMNKLTQVLEMLQKQQLQVLRTLVYSLCILASTVVWLVSFHFVFTLLFFPAVLATYLVPAMISGRADPYLRQEPRTLARLGNFLHVAFSAHWILRLKGAAAVKRRLETLARAHFYNQAGKWLAWNLGYNSKVTFNFLTFSALIWGGGALYLAGSIRLSEFVAVYLLITMVTPKLDDLYRLYVGGQALRTNYEAVDELLELPGPMAEPDPSAPQPVCAPARIDSLRLENVSFRYRAESADVLRNVSLEFRRGRSYVVSGGSGSGKTTLVYLLLGLLHPDSGCLLVNGLALDAEARRGFWSRVSLHEQSNFLFVDRTAADNLHGEATAGERSAQWDQLASDLGLASWADKPTTELSGGERQRLCLLRTLAKPADVYIFDEPTSALDRHNVAIVMAAIHALRDAIVLVISHDPSVQREFDEVLHLEAGAATFETRHFGTAPA